MIAAVLFGCEDPAVFIRKMNMDHSIALILTAFCKVIIFTCVYIYCMYLFSTGIRHLNCLSMCMYVYTVTEFFQNIKIDIHAITTLSTIQIRGVAVSDEISANLNKFPAVQETVAPSSEVGRQAGRQY